MQQVNSGRIGCFIGATFLAFASGFFLALPFSLHWILYHTESKNTQFNDLESDLGNLDYRKGQSPSAYLGSCADRISIGRQMLILRPKSVEGYEVLIGGLIAIGASENAEKVYRGALAQGIKLPPLSSDEYQ